MTKSQRAAVESQRRRMKRDTEFLRVVFWAFGAFIAGIFCGANLAALNL